MPILVDDKDKNRFTKQIELAASGNEAVYFMLSAGGVGADIGGDVHISSFVDVVGVTSAVGARYEGTSFFLSANGSVYSGDVGHTSATVVVSSGSSLTVTVTGYGMYGIMSILFSNGDSSNAITIVTNIEFLNLVGGEFMSEILNPPPIP